ncbi:MAG: VCBS repeat-containing protein [Candidatus Nitrosotenuis sp.]
MRLFTLLIISIFLYSCTGPTHEVKPEQVPQFKIIDVSNGLPSDGLWRQNITLFDMNGDGLLDIVTPPPRKAEAGKKRPFVFLQSGGIWVEGKYRFPMIEDYDYGGVTVGDINKDGYPDIILSCHEKRIIVLVNDRNGGFNEAEFPERQFKSRTVALADLNNDGYPDIVALSEFPSLLQGGKGGRSTQIQGILIGLNKQGNGFNINIIKEGSQFFGDSLSLADINNDGNMDIVIASATAIREYKKVLWLGDGKGGFEYYNADFTGDMVPSIVRTGDIDGDGRDEIVFKLSGVGKDAEVRVAVFNMDLGGIADITNGLKSETKPVVFDMADIDGDQRDELILLSEDGLHIYKYDNNAWSEIKKHPIPSIDTTGAYDMKVRPQADGSWLIVYNLGSEATGNKGIRAFLLRR